MRQEVPAPPPSTPPAAPGQGRGGPSGLLENQSRRAALAEGGKPLPYGMRIPTQGHGSVRGTPALGQEPDGVPSLPLPGCRARISRWCTPGASISHCSRNRSISPMPSTIPLLLPASHLRLPRFYRTLLHVSPWLWFSPLAEGQVLISVPPIAAASLAVYSAMRKQGITKAEMAEQLKFSEDAVGKLLDPRYRTHVSQIEKALKVVGRSLIVEDREAVYTAITPPPAGNPQSPRR